PKSFSHRPRHSQADGAARRLWYKKLRRFAESRTDSRIPAARRWFALRLPRAVLMEEKRKIPRRRVLKEGKIVYADGLRVLDCTIRDMSASGARLLISSTVGLPD
ncbi:hypothetical protein MXD81_19270, partial [Microbacteriaceae bacterium K1510]|nr:hypothetical protein [Microbacteriaceae bacterium K1510]